MRTLKFHLSGCLAGFYGTDCLKPCDKTFYGEQCSEKCNCSTHICHHIHGCIFGKNIYIYIFVAWYYLFDLRLKEQWRQIIIYISEYSGSSEIPTTGYGLCRKVRENL